MRVCTGLDELILNVNDSRIFRCGRYAGDGCPRMVALSAWSAVFPHLSKAYNTFILNLSETLNANSFFALFQLFAFLPRGAKQLKA